ncbi:MAG: putative RNA binding protein YcfA (HicA-like mRNA interferase family) [Verrucomicrobiales bacterium]|jgi:predicted RNA binding protein YcfA (HicA-like mRNA interferase family)
MPQPPKVSQILRLLKDDCWALKSQRGSHRQFAHPIKPGKVTINGKSSAHPSRANWESIQKQAGWK